MRTVLQPAGLSCEAMEIDVEDSFPICAAVPLHRHVASFVLYWRPLCGRVGLSWCAASLLSLYTYVSQLCL